MSRTITTTTTLYTYEELSETAQAYARDAYRDADTDDCFASEWKGALKRAAEVFGLEVGDWEVGAYTYSFCHLYVAKDSVADLRGVRAFKYLNNNFAHEIAESCPFTGYCGDESFLDPLRAFLARPDQSSTVQDIMKACATAWAKGWQADMEGQREDEAVAETLIANEYEFTAEGKLV